MQPQTKSFCRSTCPHGLLSELPVWVRYEGLSSIPHLRYPWEPWQGILWRFSEEKFDLFKQSLGKRRGNTQCDKGIHYVRTGWPQNFESIRINLSDLDLHQGKYVEREKRDREREREKERERRDRGYTHICVVDQLILSHYPHDKWQEFTVGVTFLLKNFEIWSLRKDSPRGSRPFSKISIFDHWSNDERDSVYCRQAARNHRSDVLYFWSGPPSSVFLYRHWVSVWSRR